MRLSWSHILLAYCALWLAVEIARVTLDRGVFLEAHELLLAVALWFVIPVVNRAWDEVPADNE